MFHGTSVYAIGARSFVIGCLVLAAAGCKPHFPEAPTPAAELSSIQLHYNSPHQFVSVGNSVSLTLYAIDSEGIFENVTTRASWVSVNPEIASVTPGSARGQRGGFTDIIVSYGGMTVTARVVVVFAGQITSMTIRPGPTVMAGQTSAFRALIGSTNDVTQRSEWTSSDHRVLTVSGGVVTGVGPGTAALIANLDSGNSATLYVSVPPIRSLP